MKAQWLKAHENNLHGWKALEEYARSIRRRAREVMDHLEREERSAS